MNLFDFIASNLQSSHKEFLFEDQSVALCFFRIALSSKEQQMLYKLMFEPQGMKPKAMAERFLCTNRQ